LRNKPAPTSICTSEPREIDLNPFGPFQLGDLVARGHRLARDVSIGTSAVGLAERLQVAGFSGGRSLCAAGPLAPARSMSKAASPSAADVVPHCVRFALNLVQLMFDNVADADDAAKH
jgi:hypothetical protein